MLNDPNLTRAERKQLRDQRPRDPGRTLEDAFRIASELLLGTPAYRSPAAVRQSYLRVRKTFRDPSTAFRYFQLSLETRRHFFGEAFLFPEERPVKCRNFQKSRH